ncbi:polysaccharide biosynthesis protein [Pontibacter saemangeumensis]|uniref:polysaccharide biosynthesis protein n=1 Tax=Pontibacter saemangeumensis TaxID=1084525 RepID=UPI0031EC53CB
MKVLGQQVYSSTSYARAREWGKLITITGSAQVIVQSIGFTCGILIIRLLPTEEYALYTLANAMLGTMTVLADGGVSTGVMSQGGKVWKNNEKLGTVLITGLELRRNFATISLVAATPILFYLLSRHGASWLMSLLIVASLVPAFFSTLSGNLLEVAPKLWQDIFSLQKIQVGINIGRFLLLALTLFAFPWAFVALLAAGLPQIGGNLKLLNLSKRYADWNQSSSPLMRREILSFVKLILPSTIYYCLSGQITIWLLSVFGSTAAIAQVGALGRLAVMLSLISILINTLFIPRFARLTASSTLLLKRIVQITGVVVLVSALILSGVLLFPSKMLWVLGEKYLNLKFELFLTIIGSCLGLIAGTFFSAFTSRGWAINPLISIPISLLAIVLGIIAVDVSTLKGALMFTIFINTVQVLINGTYCILKIFTIDKI